MSSPGNESCVIHLEEPVEYSIPQDTCIFECFYVKLYYTYIFRRTQSSTIQHTCLVPRSILCDCDEFELLDPNSITNTFLRYTFSSVPIPSDVLDWTLLQMGAFARDMIENNIEGHRILEMHVTLKLDATLSEALETIVNSLEKVKVDDDATRSMEPCAICLEEFCKGAQKKHVRTKCMHVFHENCIVRWLRRCHANQSYSCPLCRSPIR